MTISTKYLVRLAGTLSHSLIPLAFLAGCDSSPPPGSAPTVTLPSAIVPPDVENVPAPSAAAPEPTASSPVEEERPPWTGPFLGVTRSSIGIYAEPDATKRGKIGYAQEGAKVPIYPDKVGDKGCSQGWYRLVDGGYVCSNGGTLKLEDPRIKFGPSQPNLDDVLPYRYARNTKNGTPLYKSVPSQEQVKHYEPYLFPDEQPKAKKAEKEPAPKPEVDEATRRAREEQARRMEALRAARRAMLGESADEPAPPADKEAKAEVPLNEATTDAGVETKNWWQEEDPALHKLRIEDLREGGDDVLSSRMVKGFYIAVDKVFDWNKRRWLKSTKGYVAPAERFHFAAGSDFHGVELKDDWQLPIGFVYGFKEKRSTYSIDEQSKQIKVNGTVKRFQAVNLTGDEIEINKKTYVKAIDGSWLRASDLRITRPGPPPPEVGLDESWVDVNLSAQTVVAFRGTHPFYATLISSGKENKDPEKDHRTPVGTYRVREKHITATMDGDGTAAGDLPYSIEGVPYVMYFHKAYALHGAFWHNNFGVRMSHGCVNLAPLDAKFLFFNTEPKVPEGWHGAWSSDERNGSLIVVHE